MREKKREVETKLAGEVGRKALNQGQKNNKPIKRWWEIKQDARRHDLQLGLVLGARQTSVWVGTG